MGGARLVAVGDGRACTRRAPRARLLRCSATCPALFPATPASDHPAKDRPMTPSLPTRPLGTSGLSITTVGFGDWAFGWGPQDDADSIAAMRHAVDRGVNWIDTAAVYGLGHSEEVVGRLLRERPHGDRPAVFTKCGLIWDEREP